MKTPLRFRWLLRLFPRSFREEYEAELMQTWQADIAQPRFWRRTLLDTLRVAPAERVADCARNVRIAARQLRRAPGYTLAAVLTLALGTGATGGVFGLIDAVLLMPLPWRDPGTVGLLWAVQPSGERTWLSYPELDELQHQRPGLADVAGFTDLRLGFTADGVTRELQALAVSRGLFALLGVQPSLGRDFTSLDDRVVILSDAFWRTRFAANPAVLGQTLQLNGRAYAIVGVLPPSFGLLPASSVLPEHADVWLTLEPHLLSRARNVRSLHALARLSPETTYPQVDARLRAFAAHAPTVDASGPWSFTIDPFSDHVLRHARRSLTLLFGLVALVLLMACGNVAQLMLARGESRRTEIATRIALGASPARLAGELLTEACLLTVAGTFLGCVIAAATPLLLRLLDPAALPRLAAASFNWHVVAFMAALACLTLLLSAALPLIARPRLGKALVVVQAAFATTVLASAVSLTAAVVQLQQTPLGFETKHRISARLSLTPGTDSTQFFDRLPEAAAISQLPLSGAMLGSTFFLGPGPDARQLDADLRAVTPNYFQVAGTPLLSGRAFQPSDTADSPAVAIVDETLAHRLAPALGRRIRWFRQPDRELEIVGIVPAVRHRGPAEPVAETVYRPLRQYSRSSLFLLAQEPFDLARIPSTQPVGDIQTMDQRLDHAVSRPRATTLLAGILSALALVLASVGLYGVLSFGVEQRRREFGIRLAIGASPASVRFLVLQEGLLLVAAGTLAGAAVLHGSWIASLVSIGIVVLCSAVALWVPAHRAASVDPAVTFRS